MLALLVIIGARLWLWLCVLSSLASLASLAGRIWGGGRIMTGMRTGVLVLAAHSGAAKREREFLILWPEGGPLSCSRAQLGGRVDSHEPYYDRARQLSSHKFASDVKYTSKGCLE